MTLGYAQIYGSSPRRVEVGAENTTRGKHGRDGYAFQQKRTRCRDSRDNRDHDRPGPQFPGLIEASGESTQEPWREENKMKNRRRRARLEVVDEGDTCEMTARMLSLATSLRRAAKILDQAHNESGEGRNREDFSAAFHGAPILRAQSAEIALKALWRIGHNEGRDKPPHHHNLTDLHDALTETIRKLLAEEFPEIRDPTCPHYPIPVRQGLRTILNEHETALEDWRYAYELGSLRFEQVFDEVLNTLISVGWQLHNLWLRRLREEDVRAQSQP